MRPIIAQGYGQCASLTDVDEPLGPCFFQRRLNAQSRGHNSLHDGVVVLQQCLELLVALGEGVGLLARGRTYLHGRHDIQMLQDGSQLGVAHDLLFIDQRLVQQSSLAGLHISEVRLERIGVEPEYRLREHTDGLVDKPCFKRCKANRDFAEQVIGQLYVIDAVLAVSS